MSRTVVLRVLLCAIVVGSILVVINHGPALICFDLKGQCIVQMLLTYCVPYAVSTYSSVQAILHPCRDLAHSKP